MNNFRASFSGTYASWNLYARLSKLFGASTELLDSSLLTVYLYGSDYHINNSKVVWLYIFCLQFFSLYLFFPFSLFFHFVLFYAIITIVVCLTFEIFANLNGVFPKPHEFGRANKNPYEEKKNKKNVIHICHHERTMQKVMQLWKIPAFHRFVIYLCSLINFILIQIVRISNFRNVFLLLLLWKRSSCNRQAHHD